MGWSSYIPMVGAVKTLTGKGKVKVLKKLSRKNLRRAWYAKHPSGFTLERGNIDIALNKLTKKEIALLIAYT